MSSAPSFQVTLEGFDSLQRALRLAEPECRKRVQGVIERRTKTVLAEAEAVVPHKTGELASSGRDEYKNDGLEGRVQFGIGQLERRSRATTERGKSRFEKIKRKREERKLQFALANTSKQAYSVADIGAYAPIVDRGDPKRNKPARRFLTGPFDTQKPGIITDVNGALTGTVDTIAQAAGGTP